MNRAWKTEPPPARMLRPAQHEGLTLSLSKGEARVAET
jgi:hypothetical protein